MRPSCASRALAALTLGAALCGIFAGAAQASDPLAYVTNQQAGTISQVDLATGTLGTPISVGSAPDAIAITPDGSVAYVADYGSSQIVPVALATAAAGTPILLPDRPNAIAITPNGRTAYVISDTGREWPIKLATGQVGNPIQIPTNADAIAISPSGGYAYITDVAAGTITPLDLSPNGVLGQPINLPASTPDGIALTPDGSTAYVASNSDGTLTPVNIASGIAGSAIPAGTEPTSVAIAADGSTAYVTDFSSGQITPITLATGTDGTPISVGSQPSAIALVPPSGITTAPVTGGGTGTGGAAGSGSGSNTIGNQQLTLTLSAPSGGSATAETCRAADSAIRVRVTRKTLRHGAALTLRYVNFTLGRRTHRVRRLPATVRLSLRGLSPGSHLLVVRAFYSEKVASGASGRGRRKLTVTVSRRLTMHVTVC